MDDQFKSEENQTPKNENFNQEVSNGPTEDELEAANLDTEPVGMTSTDESTDNARSSSGPSFSFQTGDKSKTKVVEKQTVIEKPVNQSSGPNDFTEKPKSGKKRALIIVLIILLIVGGAVAWFLLKSDKAEAPQNSGNQGSEQAQGAEKEELKPYALAYSDRIGEPDVTPDCSPPPEQKAYLSPLDGTPKIDSASFGNVYPGISSVYKQKVAVVTYSGCDASEGQTIWYSQNSGESYEKIYTAKKPESQESLGEQITSVNISSDGNSIVFALLESDGSKNTVKELNPSTKEVKDLFMIEQRGVFIKGYDKTNNKIYYFVGCYNCGGGNYNKLYVRDIESDNEEVVFEHDRIGFQTVFNRDFSKILVNKESQGDGIGGGPPYDIEEFDIATKTFKNLKTITDKGTVIIGYTEKQEPYYTNQNKIIKVVEDGTEITEYESPKPIVGVYLVSENQVVYSSGEYNNFEVINYNSQEKSSKSVLNSDGNIIMYGVTWK